MKNKIKFMIGKQLYRFMWFMVDRAAPSNVVLGFYTRCPKWNTITTWEELKRATRAIEKYYN